MLVPEAKRQGHVASPFGEAIDERMVFIEEILRRKQHRDILADIPVGGQVERSVLPCLKGLRRADGGRRREGSVTRSCVSAI